MPNVGSSPPAQAPAEHAAPEAPAAQLEGPMLFEDQQILGYFLRLTPSRYSRALGENADEVWQHVWKGCRLYW